MTQSIPLWGVVTPQGEPVVGSLDYTQHGAAYRYGAVSRVEPEQRTSWWRDQQTKGYRVRPFILKEKTHG